MITTSRKYFIRKKKKSNRRNQSFCQLDLSKYINKCLYPTNGITELKVSSSNFSKHALSHANINKGIFGQENELTCRSWVYSRTPIGGIVPKPSPAQTNYNPGHKKGQVPIFLNYMKSVTGIGIEMLYKYESLEAI